MTSNHTNPDERGQADLDATSCVSDPNGDGLTDEITARFRDGSQVTIAACGIDEEGRQRYAYHLTDSTGATVEAGDDLRSGVGEPVDHRGALAAWVSFANNDAEIYRSTMDGNAMQEWAYMHDDELSWLSCELESAPDSGDSTARTGDQASATQDSDAEQARCSQCDEPAVHQPPSPGPWVEVWTGAPGQPLPEWSHIDGQPLCPVVGEHGYQPAQPTTTTAVDADDDTDGM